MDWLVEHEAQIRLGFFFGVLLLMGLWETLRPLRQLHVSRGLRWANNLGLVLLNTLLLRLLFPTAAVGMALFTDQHGWGLFNWLAWPAGLELLLAVLLLDFAIWLQHVMVHAIPLLWRLHRVHHADPDYDVTTGLRFHPLEILLSMVIKFAVIAALGPSLAAVILFEVILNAMAMFNHGNVSLPAGLDRSLRLLLVTPDMHRVHHSVNDWEANSNFGFNLSLWDRLFGTYIDQPAGGQLQMRIGIHGFDRRQDIVLLPGLLRLPLRPAGGYVINRRENWTPPAD